MRVLPVETAQLRNAVMANSMATQAPSAAQPSHSGVPAMKCATNSAAAGSAQNELNTRFSRKQKTNPPSMPGLRMAPLSGRLAAPFPVDAVTLGYTKTACVRARNIMANHTG